MTKEELSGDIVGKLNGVFQLAFAKAAEQRSRTTQFFADELRAGKRAVEEHRGQLYVRYTEAKEALEGKEG